MRKNPKERIRKEADKAWQQAIALKWGMLCESCGKVGNVAHHYYPKGSHPSLRYDSDNGIYLCQACHFLHHTKDEPDIMERVRTKRGKGWLTKLKKKSLIIGAQTNGIKWFENNLKKLNETN